MSRQRACDGCQEKHQETEMAEVGPSCFLCMGCLVRRHYRLLKIEEAAMLIRRFLINAEDV